MKKSIISSDFTRLPWQNQMHAVTFPCTLALSHSLASKTLMKKIKSYTFSEILRPIIGHIDPIPLLSFQSVSCRISYSVVNYIYIVNVSFSGLFVIILLPITCNYVVSVRTGFLFLLVLGKGSVILLWHSRGLPYNEPRREKTCLRGFLPGLTQTVLYSRRSLNFRI